MDKFGFLSKSEYKRVQALSPVLNVDAIIFNDDNEIHLYYRTVIPHKNMWSFLGGRLRKNEDVHDCLLRHVEESGLIVLDYRFAGYYDWKRCDCRQHALSLVFLVKVEGEPTMGKFFSVLPMKMPMAIRKCIHKFFYKENV